MMSTYVVWLQAELQELSTEARTPSPAPPPAQQPPSQESLVSMLQDRHKNYQLARDQARQAGDSSKGRRMDRGLKVRQPGLLGKDRKLIVDAFVEHL